MKRSISLLILGGILVCGTRQTEGQSTSEKPKRFTVAPVTEQRAENSPEVFIIATEEHKFSLTVPQGCAVFYHEQDRIVTLRRSQGAVTIRFKDATQKTDWKETWLEELQKRYPGSEALDQPPLRALSQPAISFDLAWSHASGLPQTGRFALVVMKDMLLEFTLVCGPDEFETMLPVLMQVMATMRAAGADGQLQIRSLRPE